MKHILILIILFYIQLHAQLKEFEIKERKAPDNPVVFVNYPDDAALIIYSSLKDINYESNIEGIINIKTDSDKHIIIVTTERQILKVKKPGFIEGRISVPKLSPRDVRYYTIEQKDAGLREIPVNIVPNPEGSVIYINDKLMGVTTNFMLTPGKHKIKVTKDGYKDKETELMVSEKNSLFFIKLEPVFKVRIKDPKAFRVIEALANMSMIYSGRELTGTDYLNFDLFYTKGYCLEEPTRLRYLSGTVGSYIPLSGAYQFLKGVNIDQDIFFLENRTLFPEAARHLINIRLLKVGFTYSMINDRVEVVTFNLHYSPGIFKKNIRQKIEIKQPGVESGSVELDYTAAQLHYIELSGDLIVPLPKRSSSFPLQLEAGFRYFLPASVEIKAKGDYYTLNNGILTNNLIDRVITADYNSNNMQMFYFRVGIPVYGLARL